MPEPLVLKHQFQRYINTVDHDADNAAAHVQHAQVHRHEEEPSVIQRRRHKSHEAYFGDCGQRLLHTHLIQHCGSSVVKQAASIPAEVSLPVVLTCVADLDLPEVFWNMCLNLPARYASSDSLSGSRQDVQMSLPLCWQ